MTFVLPPYLVIAAAKATGGCATSRWVEGNSGIRGEALAAELAANADGETGDGSRLMLFEPVGLALNTCSAVEHVRVDHRGLEVAVAEELLHGADVVAGQQKMGRERVT